MFRLIYLAADWSELATHAIFPEYAINAVALGHYFITTATYLNVYNMAYTLHIQDLTRNATQQKFFVFTSTLERAEKVLFHDEHQTQQSK